VGDKLRGLRRRIGRRGAVLAILGAIDLAQAATLVFPTGSLGASYEWFGSVAPLISWAFLWAFVGVVCLAHVLRQDDHLAFVLAIGAKILWGIGCFAAWIMSDVTVLGGILWIAFAGIVGVIAGWAEPTVIVVEDDPEL
jgi:hypothetical protein